MHDELFTEARPSENKTRGFYGTANGLGVDVEMAWQEASMFLVFVGGYTPHAARFILDSRLGRQIADELSNLMHRERISPSEVNMEDIHNVLDTVTTNWKGGFAETMDEFYRSPIQLERAMVFSPIVKQKLAALIDTLTAEEKHIIEYGLRSCADLGDDSATDKLASELGSLMTHRSQGEALDIAYHVIHSWRRKVP